MGDPAIAPTIRQLVVLPHAGASGEAYRNWLGQMSSVASVLPGTLLGRGRRAVEQLCRNISAVVTDLVTQIEHTLDQPYALFGHSMSALVAHELTRRLDHDRDACLVAVTVSGLNAPTAREVERSSRQTLPDSELRTRRVWRW